MHCGKAAPHFEIKIGILTLSFYPQIARGAARHVRVLNSTTYSPVFPRS
jgi:hypothetical protein